MKYGVTLTRIYNGYIEVDADSADEAVAIAGEHLEEANFELGETTADYAEELMD